MIEHKVDDEMLMAFADGELDRPDSDRIAALAASDPAIAARIAGFSASASAARNAFSGLHAEPVPSAMVAAVLDKEHPSPSRAPGRWQSWPIAAGFALVAAIGGYLAADVLAPRDTLSLVAAATAPAVTRALAALPSGEPAVLTIAGRELTVAATATYAAGAGFCRQYSADSADGGVLAIACGEDGDWQVPVAVLTGADGYTPASDAGLAIIDAYLDDIGAGGDIGAQLEAGLIERGWR